MLDMELSGKMYLTYVDWLKHFTEMPHSCKNRLLTFSLADGPCGLIPKWPSMKPY